MSDGEATAFEMVEPEEDYGYADQAANGNTLNPVVGCQDRMITFFQLCSICRDNENGICHSRGNVSIKRKKDVCPIWSNLRTPN